MADVAFMPAHKPSLAAAGERAALETPPTAAQSELQRKARKAAEEFEAVFLAQMLAQMTSGIDVEAPFGGGHGEEMFRSMMNEHYATAIVTRGGMGLADSIYREIMKTQEVGYAGK